MGGLIAWFKGLSAIGKTGAVIAGFFVSSTLASPFIETPPPEPEPASAVQQEVQADVVETKTETETEEVDFKTVTQETSSLNDGVKEIKTEGKKGVRTLTYEVTYTNDVETNRHLVSNEITTEPIDKVVLVGTYVAPPPQPSTAGATSSNCDPNYTGCVPIASDVDCAGGSGNGPAYVAGPVQVIGYDIYDLDRDGDGYGCE